ncbi:MAG: Hpt domain-containing protein [Chlorobiaceae bacterium]|nr:Hpt domain-containing protein [Chlorobiaceae bacterium]
MNTMMHKEIVTIDRDLEYLVPEYLAGRHNDVVAIRIALLKADFESIRTLGHNMKGSGGGYGFEEISIVGRHLETAAEKGDAGAIERWAGVLAKYLGRIDIRYA